MAHLMIFALVALALGGVILHLARKVSRMSAASDRLAASNAALTASVEALLAKPDPTDDSAVENGVADALDALKVRVDAKLATPPVA
jgi:hypothetical protein